MSTYVYDQAWEHERERLGGLEAMWDPGTIRQIERLGIAEGWSCLEIAAGGGSVAAWLCDAVGPTGRVLATDLDTRFVEALERANLEVRRHDIVTDELPDEQFDLIHARCLLEHLPARETALERMASLLAPGGWLLVEGFDFASVAFEPPAPANLKVSRAVINFMTAAGYDENFSRRSPSALAALGLRDVAAEGRVNVSVGPAPGDAFTKRTLEHLSPSLLEAGAVSAADIDAVLVALDDPQLTRVSQMIIAAWGRR